MPVQLGKAIVGQAGAGRTEDIIDGLNAGVQESVTKEIRGSITPGRAKKTGFIVGTAVWVVLLGIVERRRRLRRLEEKLEIVVQEVAASR